MLKIRATLALNAALLVIAAATGTVGDAFHGFPHTMRSPSSDAQTTSTDGHRHHIVIAPAYCPTGRC